MIKRLAPRITDVRLSRSVYLAIVALVIAGMVVLGFVIDREHRKEVSDALAGNLESSMRVQGANLVRATETLRNDALFLARLPALSSLVQAVPPSSIGQAGRNADVVLRSQLQDMFAAFLAGRPDYFQVRYIGVAAGGRELVRVDQEARGVVAIPDAELQSKGDRDYFQAGEKLAEGQVLLSEFNLNQEHGGISLPLNHTLRAVTPVHDQAGRVHGLVVINMAVASLFKRIATDGIGGSLGYVVDGQGRYLVHPDPAMAFVSEMGSNHRLQTDFPVLSSMLKQAGTSPGKFVFGRYDLGGNGYVVAALGVPFDSAQADRHILLVQAVPESALEKGNHSYLTWLALVEALVAAMILLAVFLFIKYAFKPLYMLRKAAVAMSQGQYDVELPDAETGEIGALVRDFEQMREQILSRKSALRERNALLAQQLKNDAMELRLADGILDNTSEGVMVTDSHTRIIAVNPAFTEITGYTATDAIGNTPQLLSSDHHDAGFYQAIWDTLLSVGRWQGEIWNRRKNGEVFREWLTIIRVAGDTTEDDRYIGIFTDVTELRRKDERIHNLAFHDPLTGLPNRTLAQDRLQHAIDMARRKSLLTGVMLIDLDRFKAINDSIGHDVGDLLLKEVAQRLTHVLRRSDTVARLGGDEFLVILESELEPEVYAGIAENIIKAIAEPMEIRGQRIHMGASIGVALYPGDGEDVSELIKHADVAMYAAKADGKGVLRFFNTVMTERVAKYLALETELRHGIANGELALHYQPKVSLSTGQLYGVEALVRWQHPVRGLVSPADFIPVAEESGLIIDLGDWVLQEACRQAALWQGRMGSIAVNVSARQFDKVDLVERIRELTSRHGITPASIQLELTESTVMTNPERTIGLLDRVRELGITVAVDDFGTGYSSLSYLRRLPIDTLKIDRSFILNTGINDEDTQIVNTIIALGQTLKMTVVAEGVETEAQAALLRELGCDIGQGYLYARPQPAVDLEGWLEARQGARTP